MKDEHKFIDIENGRPDGFPIRTFDLTFSLRIYPRQLPHWRGAFIEMAGKENDLFHNHDQGNGNHYRYPLIQYRVNKGKAGIFAINEGVDALQDVLFSTDWKINWNGKPLALSVSNPKKGNHMLQMTDTLRHYKLFKYLPFNADNYQAWLRCRNLTERIALLERVLASHHIAFFADIGWRLPERLEISLQNIQLTQTVKCHDVPMLAFNLTYAANVLLPTGLALGKAVSHGFGWSAPARVKQAWKESRRDFHLKSGHENGQLVEVVVSSDDTKKGK